VKNIEITCKIMSANIILITGQPSSGKSTMVRKIVDELRQNGWKNTKGFYTSEIRESNNRIGFDIHDLSNEKVTPLARIR
jgi:nucleoside-triphosphatase THEP1